MPYVLTKIKTRTSRGESTAVEERAKGDVLRTGKQAQTVSTTVEERANRRLGGRKKVSTTAGSGGGASRTANTGTAAKTGADHESFRVRFQVKIKSGISNPDGTPASPPLPKYYKPQVKLDADGNPVLDGDGNPIYVNP